MNPISFFVSGHPKTAGSKRAFIPKGWTRAIITDAAGKAGKDWRHDVKQAAAAAYSGPPLTGPLLVKMSFVMARPKSHFRTGRRSSELRDDAPTWHVSKPDVLKMARAVEDALTGVIWRDDSQIASESIVKVFGTNIGVQVDVYRTSPVADNDGGAA